MLSPRRAAVLVLSLALLVMPSPRANTPVAATVSDALTPLGQVGGPVSAVAVQGDAASSALYAYLGVGPRLVVLDVSDPTNPIELGSTAPFPSFVEDIAVHGTLAYVAAGDSGLRVVDASNPTRPQELGAWDSPGYAEGVALSGTLICLADGPNGLHVLDVSDPSAPLRLSSAWKTHFAFDVLWHGGLAYVAAGGSGLLVVDLQNPTLPVEVGQVDTPGNAYGVAGDPERNPYIYVADGWGGLVVLDITRPTEPLILSRLAMPGWALDVTVEGGLAYVADGAFGLRVIDVQDAGQPREVGAWTGADLARRLVVSGSTVLLADTGLGLHLLDVHDPAVVTKQGVYSPIADARQVAVEGGLAAVASGFQGLRLVDVSQPTSPMEVGSFDCAGAFAMGTALHGTVAFVGTTLQRPHDKIELRVIDVTEPASPTLLAAWDAPADFGPFREMVVQDGRLYVAEESGLGVVDVSDPAHPAALGHLWFDLERKMATVGVAVQGQYAYVAYAAYGLRVVDVSRPADLHIVGSVLPQGGCAGVAVAGDRAYCVSGFDGLAVIDVSQPTSPTVLGRVDTPGYATAVTLAGELALVSDGGGGLVVVDVADGHNPRVMARADTPGSAWQATAAGGRVYVADGRGGLSIYELAALVGGAAPETGATALETKSGGSRAEPGEEQRLAASRREDLARLTAAEQAAARLRVTYAGLFTPAGPAAVAVTHTVTTTADSGPGTLRAALLAAGPGDTILFDPAMFPPSQPATITLQSALPPLAKGGLTLDGSSAGVVLDGRLLPDSELGLWLPSDGNAVRGLTLVHFALIGINVTGNDNTLGGDRGIGVGPSGQGNVVGFSGGGIQLGALARGNHVEGNLVGTDPTGSVPWFNWMGVGLGIGPTDNVIGGPTAGRRNLISGNQTGVQLLGEGTNSNVVAGNLIGTDLSGSYAIPNQWGVELVWSAAGNVIGGDSPAERNWISGNSEHGILLGDSGTANNAIIGNWIGTDASGNKPLGNQPGIGVYGCGWNRIGGAKPGEGNVIVSERGYGVDMAGYDASDNVIVGNWIGLAADGLSAPGNGVGLNLHVAARRTLIGGAGPADGNLIAGNSIGIALGNAGTEHNWVLGNVIGGSEERGQREDGIWIAEYASRNRVQGNTIACSAQNPPGKRAGVRIEQGAGNTLRRNSMWANGDKGILLVDGGNQMLPAPVIEQAASASVSGTACPGCTVELYSGEGNQGRWYEGATVAGADGRFAFTKTGGCSGPFLTATATDALGNTSEFSAPALVIRARVSIPVVTRN